MINISSKQEIFIILKILNKNFGLPNNLPRNLDFRIDDLHLSKFVYSKKLFQKFSLLLTVYLLNWSGFGHYDINNQITIITDNHFEITNN